MLPVPSSKCLAKRHPDANKATSKIYKDKLLHWTTSPHSMFKITLEAAGGQLTAEMYICSDPTHNF